MPELLTVPKPAETTLSIAMLGDIGHDVVQLVQATEASRLDEVLDPTPKEEALIAGAITAEEIPPYPDTAVTLKNGEVVRCREGYPSQKDRAAYLVDKTMGFGLVPTTVMRSFATESGYQNTYSFQENIPDGKNLLKRLPEREEIDVSELSGDELYKVWLLDYMIWNTDGGKHNLIVTPVDNKLHAFDHPNAFEDDEDRPTHHKQFLDNMYGLEAPDEVVAAAHAFLKDQLLQEGLLNELSQLIREPEAKACVARMIHVSEILATKGKINSEAELAEFSPS